MVMVQFLRDAFSAQLFFCLNGCVNMCVELGFGVDEEGRTYRGVQSVLGSPDSKRATAQHELMGVLF